MIRVPSFEDFYRALWARDPFPWQRALAAKVEGGDWPALLDLPTGIGKTSALDVALYALARDPERSPRRIVLVVDRRVVVDQGADHAREIQRRMLDAGSGPVRELADALRGLFGGSEAEAPFAVAVLRGGAPRDDDWAKRPDQPVLGVSTVDQVGSRLLFRGYGVSPKLASIHAGLMGNDTLILLDEVHLAIPFAETLRAVQAQYNEPGGGLPRRFKVVEMSATPTGARPSSVLGLSAEDRAHPVVRERLEASKAARLVELKVKGKEPERRDQIARAAAAEVSSLRAAGAKVIGVVVNRVDTARLVHRALASEAGLGRVVLVTGRMRPLDRDRVVGAELRYADAARDRAVIEPVVVVATQCIEAGADLDFDALVTELASFDALKQRFGRLDRRGQVTQSLGHAPAVILGRSDMLDAESVDAVYGSSLAATWSYLETRVANGVVDFGVSALSVNPPAPELAASLVLQSKRAPVLLPGHIDAWTQTSPLLRPEPDPDVALWLHGPERESAEVQIVWRADLVDEDLARWADDRDRREAVQESLALVRPSTLEALSLPLHAARAWLAGEAVPAIADVLAEASSEERRRSAAAEGPVALVRRDEAWRPAKASELRPGDVLVVPQTRGGLRAGSFDPDASEPVIDLADLAQLRGRGVLSLRTHPEALRWLEGAPEPPKPSEESTPREDRLALQAWLGALEGPPPAGVRDREWERLRTTKLRRDPVVVKTRSESGKASEHLLLVQRLARDPKIEVEIGEAYSDDDRSSFTSSDLGLRQHSSDVRGKVELFVRALGLPESVARDLALAGWLHDVGKVDPRFQLMLSGGDEVRLASLDEPLAKSRLPNMSGEKWKRLAERAELPQGYRHELSSLAMIEHAEELRSRASDFDLVLHLVASHHGWCRPFAPASATSLGGPAPALSFDLSGDGELRLRGSAEHAYAALDGGVADRFWRVQERYGPWGLAWLEAILRLADHRASEDVEERGGRR